MPLRAPAGLRSIGRTLSHRNGRVFYAGSLLAWTGMWIQRVAVGWLAWDLTNSPFWLGLVVFCDLFPAVVVAPIAGAIADRTDRIRLTMAAQSLTALQSLTLGTLVVTGVITIELLLLLELLVGVSNSFTQPARQTLVPALVSREDLPAAVALNSLTFNVARFAGPAISGVMIVWTGVAPAIFVNAASYIVATFSLLLLQLPPADRLGHAPTRSLRAETLEGFRYAARHRGIGPLLLFAALNGVFARPFLELLPAFADSVFHRGAPGLAMLASVTGGGALVAGLVLAARGGTRGLTLIGIGAGFVMACGGFLFVATDIFAVGLLGAAVAAAAQIVHGVAIQTLVQGAADRAMRGRVLSLWGLIVRACPAIGALGLGALAEVVGLRLAVAVASAACLPVWWWGMQRQRRVAAVMERGIGPKPPPPAEKGGI
jgi:MFS family permease